MAEKMTLLFREKYVIQHCATNTAGGVPQNNNGKITKQKQNKTNKEKKNKKKHTHNNYTVVVVVVVVPKTAVYLLIPS